MMQGAGKNEQANVVHQRCKHACAERVLQVSPSAHGQAAPVGDAELEAEVVGVAVADTVAVAAMRAVCVVRT